MSENKVFQENTNGKMKNARECGYDCADCKHLCACAVCENPICDECVCSVCNANCDDCECSICENPTCVGCELAPVKTVSEQKQAVAEEQADEPVCEAVEDVIEVSEGQLEMPNLEDEVSADQEEPQQTQEEVVYENVCEVRLSDLEPAIEEVAEESPVEEPVAEEVAEESPVEEVVAEEVVEEVPVEEVVAEEVVEEVTVEEPVAEEVVEEVPVEEPVTEAAEQPAEAGEQEASAEEEAMLNEEDEPEAPDPEESSKEERKRMVEELIPLLAIPPRRRYIAAPSEKAEIDDEYTVEVLNKSEMKENVQSVFKALIKEGVKLGYLDKYDGLSASEIKEEYEGELVYEVADQELRKMAIKVCQVKKETKVGVYAFSWDGTDVHHIGYLNEPEKAEALIPYLEDKDNYVFNICGIITGGKFKSVEKDPKTEKIKIKNCEGLPYGVELDIAIYKKIR